MRIKGINAVTREINKFLKPFGIKSKFGMDFAFYPLDNPSYITWSLLVGEKHENTFKKFLKETFDFDIECDIFLIDLLHELGHFMTEDSLTDIEQELCANEREVIDNDPDDSEEIFMTYYNLYDEKLATEWAVNFMLENTEVVKNFWERVKPKVLRIYEINRIEVE